MGERKRIIILGATGGCVDILDTINDINNALQEPAYECIGFLDDNSSLWNKKVMGIRVLGPFNSAGKYADDSYFVTGIGSPYNFWEKENIIIRLGVPIETFATVIHPTATLSTMAELGRGCVIHQQVTITRNVKIGNHVLVLPNAVISHQDIIGDYSIINAGACISGEVKIGRSCYIGANSTVRQNITI